MADLVPVDHDPFNTDPQVSAQLTANAIVAQAQQRDASLAPQAGEDAGRDNSVLWKYVGNLANAFMAKGGQVPTREQMNTLYDLAEDQMNQKALKSDKLYSDSLSAFPKINQDIGKDAAKQNLGNDSPGVDVASPENGMPYFGGDSVFKGISVPITHSGGNEGTVLVQPNPYGSSQPQYLPTPQGSVPISPVPLPNSFPGNT